MFKPYHQTEDAFSIRRCMLFTEAIAREATAMKISPTDLLFSFTQMLVSLCITKGYEWDKIQAAMEEFYLQARARRAGIVLT